MSKSDQLDLQFARAMRDHPYGVAMFRPPRSSVLRLGTVGYFDDFGAWNIIVDLTNANDLARRGLGSIDVAEIEAAPVDNAIKWGPILSTNTKSSKISLSGGVAPVPGIPVNASAAYSYSATGDTGAILLTTPPVRHERFYHTSPFKQWMKENAPKLMKKYPDEVKQHGIWIVTSTYTTDKCSILMWRDQSKKFNVGFSADVSGAGSIKPDLEWYGANTDEGWGEYTAEGNDRPVVFFGGLRFTASPWYKPKKTVDLQYGIRAMSFRTSFDPYAKVKETVTTVLDEEDEDQGFEIQVEERLDN